jgi:hypothetical protein
MWRLLEALDEPPSLIDLRRRVSAMLPAVDIGEVILDVMAWHPRMLEALTWSPAAVPGWVISRW